ncbi:MAG: acyl-CoA thioesterase [Deltaproteobacteria bacterium]|nr:MAG: acyl-CoA thioesterase [Deltaproteobacteria bacterium]
MLSRLQHTVRSTEVDFLGHVNNAKYQEYLEWGRFGWIRDAALTRDRFAHARIAPVVVHVSLDYKREAVLDDVLTIETALVKIGNRSLHFRQRVLREGGEVACDGKVVLALFNLETRQSSALPDELRAELERLIAPRYGEQG